MNKTLLCAVLAVAAMIGESAFGGEVSQGGGCDAKAVQGRPDFSLPCILLSPIPASDQDVHFESGSATLTTPARAGLDRQIAALRPFARIDITLNGFVDTLEAAAPDEGVGLGARRALAVREYLVAHGIPADHVTTQGRGRAPIILVGPHTEAGLASMRFVRTETRDEP